MAESTVPATAGPLLHVRDLNVTFSTDRGQIHSVDGVSFDVQRGEVVALVGESGSGKSVTVRSAIGLESYERNATITGHVEFDGQPLLNLDRAELRSIWRHRVGMVFQDPLTSLNPVLRIGDQMTEVLRSSGTMSTRAARARAMDLLEEVRIPSPRERLDLYPHEMSGGMRQRVSIALAIANDPDLLVADEPTTALDVTVQRALLDLLMELVEQHQMSLLLVTHNLALVSRYAHRGLVMYGGRIVEEATGDSILDHSEHPYTEGLVASIPTLATDRDTPLSPIPGGAPDMRAGGQGCLFEPRCPRAEAICTDSKPRLASGARHQVACHVVTRDHGEAGLGVQEIR